MPKEVTVSGLNSAAVCTQGAERGEEYYIVRRGGLRRDVSRIRSKEIDELFLHVGAYIQARGRVIGVQPVALKGPPRVVLS